MTEPKRFAMTDRKKFAMTDREGFAMTDREGFAMTETKSVRLYIFLSLRGTKQSKMFACRRFSDSHTFGLFRFARKNRKPATLSVLEIPTI